MKTPWKMFADLVSRKSASGSQDDSSPNDGVKAIGHQTLTDEAAPVAAPNTARAIAEEETPASVASSTVTAIGSGNHDDGEHSDPPSTHAMDGAVPHESPKPLAKVQLEAPVAAANAARAIVDEETPASVASSRLTANGSDRHDSVERADPPSKDTAPDGAVLEAAPTPRTKVPPEAPVAGTIKAASRSAAAKRRRRADPRVEQKAAVPVIDAPPDNLLRPKTVFEERSELDAEISDIRQRLAEKLSLQNAQLREMLERFDR
jgi:hypothetical protein